MDGDKLFDKCRVFTYLIARCVYDAVVILALIQRVKQIDANCCFDKLRSENKYGKLQRNLYSGHRMILRECNKIAIIIYL